MSRISHATPQQWFYRIGSFVLVVASLYLAREVFIPFALGLLISFLLRPVVAWFQRYGMGRIPAVLLAFGILFLLISGLLFQVGSVVASLVSDLPRYRTELVSKLKGIQVLGRRLDNSIGTLGKDLSTVLEAEDSASVEESTPTTDGSELESRELGVSRDVGDPDIQGGVSLARGASSKVPLYVMEVKRPSVSWQGWAESAGIVVGPLGTGGLVVVFALFLMVYQDNLRDRIIKVVSGGQYVTTTRAINESAERISSYLLAQAVVNGSYGAIIGFGLWIIGMTLGAPQGFPNCLLWGVLCALLRFIPFLGPVIASLFPLAIGLTVFPGFKVFIAVLILIVLVELMSNNLMEPWLYASSTGISAMAVIFAAVFWGWIWGPVGLLLATPLTVCLVVLGKHVSAFRIFQTLLGESEPLSVATRFYQRLLARDIAQALELARREIESSGRLHFLDSTFIPAICRIRQDRHANRLDHKDEQTLSRMLHEIVGALSDIPIGESPTNRDVNLANLSSRENPSVTENTTDDDRPGQIMLLPSHHAYEELVLTQMVGELNRLGFEGLVQSTRTRPRQLQSRLKQIQPHIVVVGVIPPGGVLQTEFLCETVRHVVPAAKILVCWMRHTKYFDRLLVRLRRSGVSYVPTSIEQTLSYVVNLHDTSEGEIDRAST